MTENGFNFTGVDTPKNENDHYSLRYASFVVPLVKAVQEQQTQIELLEKNNQTLKAQNELLLSEFEKLKQEVASLKAALK